MRRIVLLFAFAFAFVLSGAQVTFTFNGLALPDTGFCNGQNLPGYFADTVNNLSVKLYNHYDETYGSWYGFGYSVWTDDSTNSYTNQWSTFAGYLLDSTFVVGYVGIDWTDENYPNIPSGLKFNTTVRPVGFYVSNITYSALVIRDGNSFTQPFSDGDYFKLVITGYLNGQMTDTTVHYLADYTDGKNFVQKDWSYVDLGNLGIVDSLAFNLVTTDVGAYGANTPLYFAMDQLSVEQAQVTATVESAFVPAKVYPNPASDLVFLGKTYKQAQVYNLNGQKLLERSNTGRIDVSDLQPGLYIVKLFDGRLWYGAKLIVRH